MREVGQTVKVIALVMATGITAMIIWGIVGGVMLMATIFGVGTDVASGEVGGEWHEVAIAELERETVTSLKIEIGAARARVVQGNCTTVATETKNLELTTRLDGARLVVTEATGWWHWPTTDSELAVCVPKDMALEVLEIETGAGELILQNLETEQLKLDLGAGRTLVEYLTVTERTKINGGAGLVEIKDSVLTGVDLDMGVGRTSIVARFVGDAKIEAGLGKLELGLVGETADYRLEAEQGLGGLTLSGISQGGQGKHKVSVKGGVGAMEIRLVEPTE